jgi:hypothetical protein
MTARVLVPLVATDGNGEQLFEAIAGDSAPEAHPARLVPQISELFDFGLYATGQTVREAVTRMVDARRGRVWLGRRNARAAPWYLRISHLQVGRLSDENARSAGLGLTLAALLAAFRRKDVGIVFATGEIELADDHGATAAGVAAVDGIRGKLNLVGDYIGRHRGTLDDVPITVVLPRLAADGRPLAEAEARILDRLQTEASGVGAHLRIAFVETLDDLEPVFGPFALDEVITARTAAATAAVVAAVAIVGGGWYALANASIELGWLPVAAANAAEAGVEAMPRRARYLPASDQWELLPTCYDEQRTPVYVGGDYLLLNVSVEDGLPFAGNVRPASLYIAAVSREADPSIYHESRFGRVGTSADERGVFTIPIEDVEDEIRLFVLASRDADLEVAAVLQDLRGHLAGLTGSAVLGATAGFLQDRFDAQIDYPFKVTSDESICQD